MNTFIQISDNRIAKIEASLHFNNFEIKELSLITKEEEFDTTFVNTDGKYSIPKIDTVTILSNDYKPEATTLTGHDIHEIQDASIKLYEALIKQPVSLTEYFS